jgi:hypothetical protein
VTAVWSGQEQTPYEEQRKMPNQVSNKRLAGCLGSILPQSILTIAVLQQEAVITLVHLAALGFFPAGHATLYHVHKSNGRGHDQPK